MKGISPLIASVILIAITLAIAGVLAAFVTRTVQTQQTGIETSLRCRDALDISTPPSLTYSDGNLTLILLDTKTDLDLTNMTVFLSFQDGSVRSAQIGNLAAQTINSTKITSLPSKPVHITIVSSNCGDTKLADRPIA